MIAQILAVTAPVFLLAASGYIWAKVKAPFDLDFVTRLSLSFSVPCLIFATLVDAEIDPDAVRDIAVAALLAYGAAALVLAPIFAALGMAQRVWLGPAVFANTGNVGLPVALFAFGDAGLAYAIVIFAVMAILNFTLGIWLVTGAGRPVEALRQPLVYASLAGGVAAITDWAPPGWLLETFKLAGQIAIPMMLLTLGVSIARLQVGGIARATLASVMKLIVCGAAAWGVGRVLGLEGAAFGALVLQLVMPAAVTSYLLAARYEQDPEAVAGFVVVSTFLSLGAIPAVLAILLGG
ncbi:MAG: AEC family transporter [Pseudomonadota bacterium]